MSPIWEQTKIENKTVIITGANRGMGRETAFQLAQRGAKVIMGCRDITAAEAVLKELVEDTNNRNILVKKLDLGSLTSVRGFANYILATETRLDILICNAGSFFSDKGFTEDGFERNFAVNYLGHFLLVVLLLPLLKQSQPSRVIMLSSLLYVFGRVNFRNLNAERGYGTIGTYGSSKLALLLFVKEISLRLRGTRVTVNAIHPGVVMTDLFKDVNKRWQYLIRATRWLLTDVKDGAKTTVFLAVSDSVANKTGNLYYCCRKVPKFPCAKNERKARALWNRSCEMVGLNPDNLIQKLDGEIKFYRVNI